jgi:hypothetical protein
MDSAQLTIGGAIRHAWTLLGGSWRNIWGVLALNGLAATVWAAGDLSQNLGLLAAAAPALLITTLMLYGAVYRQAFADRHGDDPGFKVGHHGLQWGRMEWRMLGTMALTAAFIAFIVILLLLAVSAVLAGVLLAKGVQPTPGMTMDQVFAPLGLAPKVAPTIVLTLLMIVAVWLSVRLSLALPATADQKGVRVLRTWKLTRRHAWPIFGATLFIQLPVLIVSGWIATGVLSMEGLPQDAGPTALLLASIAIGAPLGLFVTPMLAGAYAWFYRSIPAPAEAGDRETKTPA